MNHKHQTKQAQQKVPAPFEVRWQTAEGKNITESFYDKPNAERRYIELRPVCGDWVVLMDTQRHIPV